MELYVYWLLQIGSVSCICLWNYALLKYYTDPHETVRVTLFIQVLAFSSVMIYILLIPFDVFASVRHHDALFQFKDPLFEHQFDVRIYDLYFICYVGMILLCFVWLPFSYFYAQSVQEEEEMILEASITAAARASQPTVTGNEAAKAGRMKGMDSSDSQSDEEQAASGAAKAKDLAPAQPQAKPDEYFQDADPSSDANGTRPTSQYSLRYQEIRDSQKKSSFQKFMDHSKRAIKKTVASFICLSFMLLLSFVLSTYEYNEVHTQYQRVYHDVAKKLSDGESANATVLPMNGSATKAADDASIALAQVATNDDEDSQSSEEGSKRMKNAGRNKNKKHKKGNKKHKKQKHHDAEEEHEQTGTDAEQEQEAKEDQSAAVSTHSDEEADTAESDEHAKTANSKMKRKKHKKGKHEHKNHDKSDSDAASSKLTDPEKKVDDHDGNLAIESAESKHSDGKQSNQNRSTEVKYQGLDEAETEALKNKLLDAVLHPNSSHFDLQQFLHKQTERVEAIVSSVDYKKIDTWKNQVMDSSQYGESFLRFTLTTIICFGGVLNLIYQAYGMAGLPIYLINGTKSLEAENDEIQGSIQQVREQLRRIQEKYQVNQKNHISTKDKALLKKLRKEEKILEVQHLKISNRLDSKRTSLWRYISMFLKLLTPFRVAIGVACLILTLLIVYSMFITNLDRLLNSECGFNCGYLLEQPPSYSNPLDYILLRLSSHHEKYFDIQMFLDTALFATMLIYTFICILYGIVKIGINFFSLEIYRLRRRDTLPQALSVVSILVILMMFAFSMQLMSIAPMYVTFGDQRVDGQSGEKCTLKESQISHKSMSEGHVMNVGYGCQMTMIAQLYTKIQLSLPAFTICYFMLSWAFILFFAAFLAYHAHYKQNYASHQLSGYSQLGSNDEEQDEDLQLFIKSTLREDNPALSQKIKNDRMMEQLSGQCWDNQSNLSNMK